MRILLLVPVILFSGCATIVRGQHQDVTITSTPPGAEVTVNGVSRGRTPVKVNLERTGDREVSLTLDGYQPKTVILERHVAWVCTTSNIFVGGPLSTTTDFMTGCAFQFDPDSYNVPMEAIKAETPKQIGWRRVYEFSLSSYKALGTQAAQGSGEALTTLREMLGVSPQEQASFATEILQIFADAPGAPQFAVRVADLRSVASR